MKIGENEEGRIKGVNYFKKLWIKNIWNGRAVDEIHLENVWPKFEKAVFMDGGSTDNRAKGKGWIWTK